MNPSDIDLMRTLTDIDINMNKFGTSILFFMGNLGNLCSILIFSTRSWRKNVCVFYFTFNLWCNLAYINSSMLGNFFIIALNVNAHNSNNVICKLFYYIKLLCSSIYPTVLILASIDRLLISSQNVDTRLYSSKRLAYLTVTISLFFWVLSLVHILIKVNIQEVYPGIKICYYDLSGNYYDFLFYSVLLVSAIMPLIMVILSTLAFKNVRMIRIVPRQRQRELRSMNKKDFQLLRCLFAQNIIYILFSIPIVFSVVYSRILRYRTLTQLDVAIVTFLNNIGTFFHSIPYCSSIVIFLVISRAFRQELKRWYHKILLKDWILPNEEENRIAGTQTNENCELRNVGINYIVISKSN